MKLSSILGINARTVDYAYRYNTRKGKNIADSKIQTARILKRAGIAHPQLIAKFKNVGQIAEFNWQNLPDAFALKPSRGLGGEGIIVIKRRLKPINVNHPKWITTQRKIVEVDDLKLHAQDILEGAYSMGNVPDVAFIQEYVGRHKAFRKYSFRGTPDIRIIVFNRVPVMAMLRLPTRQSGGRANLHQGAIGVGVDIATGITTKAVWYGEAIKTKPDSDRKLHGIKIPNWITCLQTAVAAQMACGLGYVGVDIVLHPDRGPLVLELNAQPGLQIQLANMAGLKKRLERVEDLQVRDAEHGVKIAKALFAERYLDRVKAEEGIKTIGASEEIKLLTGDKTRVQVLAKIDTGAWSSSIDRELATDVGLMDEGNILWYRNKISALGEEKRPVISVTFWIAGRKIKTHMTIANRRRLRYKILIGRVDLGGFLVKPEVDPGKIVKKNKW